MRRAAEESDAEACEKGSAMKAQSVRLLDVLLIGPAMVAAGLALSRRHEMEGAALAAMGALTVLYNGRNYVDRRRQSP